MIGAPASGLSAIIVMLAQCTVISGGRAGHVQASGPRYGSQGSMKARDHLDAQRAGGMVPQGREGPARQGDLLVLGMAGFVGLLGRSRRSPLRIGRRTTP